MAGQVIEKSSYIIFRLIYSDERDLTYTRDACIIIET